MASFEFYGLEKIASCQYHADEFFKVLDHVNGAYPLLSRTRRNFEELRDDTFGFENGEAGSLESEVDNLTIELKIDLTTPPEKLQVLYFVVQELKAVFEESRSRRTDICFRWG